MEQTTQQNIQKPSLSIKTKIAAWWMMLFGGMVVFAGTHLLASDGYGPIAGIIFFVIGILLFLSGTILLKLRKKWSWWLSFIVVLCIFLGCALWAFGPLEILQYGILIDMQNVTQAAFQCIIYFGPIVLLIPLVLLLLDRKNFFKIAS